MATDPLSHPTTNPPTISGKLVVAEQTTEENDEKKEAK